MFSRKLPTAAEALVRQRCFPRVAHLGANPRNLFRHFTLSATVNALWRAGACVCACGMLTSNGRPEKHYGFKNSHRIPMGRLPQQITLKMTGWRLRAHTLSEVEPSGARESADRDRIRARSPSRRCQTQTDGPAHYQPFSKFFLHYGAKT